MTHCGICHSDLHIQAGGFDMGGGKSTSFERAGARLPVTMGHEIGGEVVELGPEVRGPGARRPGDRLSLAGLRRVPGLRCAATTISARSASRNLGIQLPGGYADLVRVPHARYLVPIGNAGAGARRHLLLRRHHRLRRPAQARPDLTADDHVAIIGCGGVGMTAVALASAATQARIVAIDPDPAKREAALAHGAALAFDPGAPDAAKTIGKACGFDIAGAIDFVGAESSSSLAVSLVRRTGQVVIVGLFGGEFRMPLPMFALKSLRIIGSYVGSLADLRELVALAQRVSLPEIPLDLRPLAEVNQALQDLAAGRVLGRVVLQP